MVTSATTGAGLNELRRVLGGAVAARRAAADRITADIDALLERFAVYAGDSVPGWLPPVPVPAPDSSPAAAPPETAPADEALAEPPRVQLPARPPWEQPEPEEHEGNGRVGAADWQPWQTNAAPARSSPSARPPWKTPRRTATAAPSGPRIPRSTCRPAPGTLTAAFAKAAGAAAVTETLNGVRERSAAG